MVLDKDATASFGDKPQYPVPNGKRPGAWMPPVADPQVTSRGYHLTTDPLGEAAGKSGPQRVFLAEYKGKISVGSRRVAAESVRLVREITPDWELLPAYPAIRALLVSQRRKEFGPDAPLPEWADLTGANLYGANLSGADLRGANLYGANLSGANLYRADLTRADLTRANLTRADLYGANLSGANLSGADLTRANLSGANLTGANLSGADLYGANLYGADLYGANLTEANLSRANLYGAKITRAQLNSCRNVGYALLEGAIVGKVLNAKTAGEVQAEFRKAGRTL